ncbi:MAG: integrase arm-type DNA-binding domain-containing protein [Halopseudomonas sabulinigri]
MKALTVKGIDRIVKAGKPGLTGDGDGLYLRITRSATAGWIYRYKLFGRSRDMGLGSYPQVSLAEAREQASLARKVRNSGQDPIETRKKEQENQKIEQSRSPELVPTFRDVALDYIEAHRPGWRNAKHASQWSNTLATYAYPTIGDLAPDEVTTDHMIRILKNIWVSKPETASRVRNRIELVLDAAKARGLRDGENPARWRGHLDKLFPKRSQVSPVRHHPALPWKEAPGFMNTVRKCSGLSYRAIEMTIFTACRTSEVLNATWDEIDIENSVWTIPQERMKTRKEHRVPICSQLKALLDSLSRHEGSNYLFPGQRSGKPLSNMAMSMALRELGYDAITMHGFRSTFRDWAGECTSHPSDVCEQALAHTLRNQVEAAYRRGDLFNKRRYLMDDWAAYITCESPSP